MHTTGVVSCEFSPAADHPKLQQKDCRMPNESKIPNQPAPAIPHDNLQPNLAVAQPDSDQQLDIGVAGDTYTILPTGKDTAGCRCLRSHDARQRALPHGAGHRTVTVNLRPTGLFSHLSYCKRGNMAARITKARTHDEKGE